MRIGETDTIKGNVKRIIWESSNGSYRIAAIDCLDGISTVVKGVLPNIRAGSSYEFSGIWTEDKYGVSLETSIAIPLEESTSSEGILEYLGSGLVRGFGPILAQRVVETFGDSTADIIENDIEKLLEVPGIGPDKIEKLRDSWGNQVNARKTIIELQKQGISSDLAIKIYSIFGDRSVSELLLDPYQCLTSIEGVGFKRADKIALGLGVSLTSEQRIRGGIKYVLETQAPNFGHVFLTKFQVFSDSLEILGDPVTEKMVKDVLDSEVKKGSIIRERYGDTIAIYSPKMHRFEKTVAKLLSRQVVRSPKKVLEPDFAALCGFSGYDYDEVQREAINLASSSQVLVITGKPGCGKSTTTLGILKTFQDNGLKVLLAAPTGRAAQRLSEVTKGDAKTIHNLLEYNPEVGFMRNESNPLEGDALIVDEFSMVDLSLMYHLMLAIPKSMRLVMVGDVDQLPSVGPGLVLRDIIDSGVIPIIKLVKIFRQAQDSKIITNAHKINSGEMIDLVESSDFTKEQDFYFMECPTSSGILRYIVNFVTDLIPSKFHYLSDQIQILSPQKSTEVGVDNLNITLQGVLNPKNPGFMHGSTLFRLGDRVMHIKNNYEKGVFNGEVGKIVNISPLSKSLEVLYDGVKSRRVEYSGYDLEELTLAYASTIHKSQGNEYPVVIIPVTMAHSFMLQRNLIYTALTRAKKLCIFVGTREALFTAINNTRPSMRNSRLKERLQTLIIDEKE